MTTRNRTRRQVSKKAPKNADDLRKTVGMLIDDVCSPAYASNGTDEELRDVFDNLDQQETEHEAEQAIVDAGKDVKTLIQQLEEQMTAAKQLLTLIQDGTASRLLMAEWRHGMVECPTCAHVFRGEDHTL